MTGVEQRGARIQLSDPAVVSWVGGEGAMPGDTINVELASVDVAHREVGCQRVM